MDRELEGLFDRAREALAQFVGARSEDLAFVPNASAGVNTVLRSLRFEPGDEKEVALVPFGGQQLIYGFSNLVDGSTGSGPTPGYQPNLDKGLERAAKLGFKSKTQKP